MRTGRRKPLITMRTMRILLIVLLLLVVAIALAAINFERKHFDHGTIINGIDCSFLTAEEAKERIETAVSGGINVTVMIPVGEAKEYEITSEEIESFEIGLKDVKELEEMLQTQRKDKKQKEFQLEQQFAVSKEAVREYLKGIPELNEAMVIPQDAYLRIGDDNRLEIVPEVYGNQVDFNEALDLAVETLKKGEAQIDFTKITRHSPDVLLTNEDLQGTKHKINQFLDAKINFILPDGSQEILDISRLKDWIIQKENGSFDINVAENLDSYFDFLDEKLSEISATIKFEATGIGTIELPVPEYARMSVDREKQRELISQSLINGGETKIELSYVDPLAEYRLNKTYIELDITRQNVWCYVNGEPELNEADCVTGDVSKGTITPTGIYFLTYKTRNAELTDHKTYWVIVSYWMPFNGGIGFHDARSRHGNFGGDIYLTNGSHGCVNLSEEDAATLYKYINTNMPIFIYAS